MPTRWGQRRQQITIFGTFLRARHFPVHRIIAEPCLHSETLRVGSKSQSESPPVVEIRLAQPSLINSSTLSREKELLKQMAEGLVTKEIAGVLDISIHTVTNHIRSNYARLHVNTNTSAVTKAIREGLV
mgnify:CR=1 FL=1